MGSCPSSACGLARWGIGPHRSRHTGRRFWFVARRSQRLTAPFEEALRSSGLTSWLAWQRRRRLQMACRTLGRCVPARDGHWTHPPWPRPPLPPPHLRGDAQPVRTPHGQGGVAPQFGRLRRPGWRRTGGTGAVSAPALCASGGAAGRAAAHLSVKRDLQAKLAHIVDECGKTPPRPGVRNNSGGQCTARCRQGYTAMSTAKPLRP